MNARLYSLMLRLYPAELRHDFGGEMTQVFLDDLEYGRLREGVPGVTRVWWRSLKELFRLALPAGFSHRYVLVPAIMFALQAIYLGGLILLTHADSRSPFPHSLLQGMDLILMSGLVPATIVSITLRIGDRSVPEPLSLSRL